MKIYEMKASSDDRWIWFFTVDGPLTPAYSGDTQAFFTSQPRIRIDRNTEKSPRSSTAVLADFSSVDTASPPCFSARAKSILGPHIDGLGQWLALKCDEAPYWLFNVTHSVDALDEANSQLIRFDDGRVMRIAQFAFHPGKLQGQLLFRLPQRPGGPNLVTQDFVDLVHEHGLTGFSFRLVWSEEGGAVSSKLKDWERPRITGLEPRQA
jgi:hypothetical protein